MTLPNGRSIADYIEKWGNSSSIALLCPSCKIFCVPDIDGIIGYRLEAQCAVVLGDPVCSPEHMPNLVQAFHDHCQKDAKSVVYTIVSEQFADWALKQGFCQWAAAIGDEIILDPQCDPKAIKGKKGSSLRNKFLFSVRQGISIHEYTGNDVALEQELDTVRTSWLAQRKGPQACFFSEIHLFTDFAKKRYFYAKYKEAIVGIAMLNRLESTKGWVLNMLMKTPDAPTTTSEFLILSILDIVRQEGCPFFSIGTTPAPKLGRTEGLCGIYTWLVRMGFKIASKILNLGGRQRYWEKFQPKMAPIFIMSSRSRLGLREALGIARAFNAPI